MLDYVKFTPLPIVRTHLIVSCVLAILTLVVLGLRIHSRIIINAGIGWDDVLILIAMPQGIGMLIIQAIWTTMSIGYPIAEAQVNIFLILKLLVAYELIYTIAISTIKLSVLSFYLRVFVNPGLRLVTKFVIGLVSLWTVGNILQVFLICHPFAASYDPNVSGTCGNQVGSSIAIGAFNINTDALILTLPLRTVWILKMRARTKVALTAVFLIGLLTSVVALLRIIALTSVDLKGNLTGTLVYADFLSAIEPNLGILCVSLPMLGGVYRRYFKRETTSGVYSGNISYGESQAQRFRKMQEDSETFTMDTVCETHVGTGSNTALAPTANIKVKRQVHLSFSDVDTGRAL